MNIYNIYIYILRSSILNKKFIKVYIIIFLFLICPRAVHAATNTIPLNASSSAMYLEDYTTTVTGWTGTVPLNNPCNPGGATTHNNGLYFALTCNKYKLQYFQNNMSFHVNSPVDITQGGRYLQVVWSDSHTLNTVGSIYATAEINDQSIASSSANIEPALAWTGSPGSFVQGTIATVAYPFDITFSYVGDKATIYINDQVWISLFTGNTVNDQTFFIGQNLEVGKITSDTNGAIQDEYITCSIFDIPCNLHNFQTWLVKLVMPTTASLDEIATIKTSLDNKIPFAYFSTATGLDFSASGVATQTPGFTLPMMSAIASTSGQRFHPTTTGLTSYTFNGSTMTLIGQFSKPFFSISMWVGFIVLVVKITIKMLT